MNLQSRNNPSMWLEKSLIVRQSAPDVSLTEEHLALHAINYEQHSSALKNPINCLYTVTISQ